MWGPPLEYGNIVHDYIIEYHKHGEIPQQIYLSADAMHYAIVGLAPYTEYKFKVRAMSESGNGTWTSEVTVKTHEGSQLWRSYFFTFIYVCVYMHIFIVFYKFPSACRIISSNSTKCNVAVPNVCLTELVPSTGSPWNSGQLHCSHCCGGKQLKQDIVNWSQLDGTGCY